MESNANNLNNVIELIAKTLADKGIVINFSANSVLGSIEDVDSDSMMSNTAGLLSKQIINEVSLIKNKILPYMRDVEQAIKEKRAEFANDSEISKYNIIPRDIPKLLTVLKDRKVLKDVVEKSELGSVSFNLPVPGEELEKDITYFFKPADGKDDELRGVIEELLTRYTKADLYNIWEKYLGNISSANNNIANIGAAMLNNQENMGEILLLWSLCVNVLENQKELNIEDKENLQVAIGSLLNVVVTQLSVVANSVTANRKLGRLVLGTEDNGYTAIVDSELYTEFLNTHEPDVILGLLVAGIKSPEETFVNNIAIKAADYSKLWENKVKLDRFNAVSRAAGKSKLVYSLIIGNVWECVPDNELKELRAPSIDMVRTELDKLLATLTPVQLEDETAMARLITSLVIPNSLFFKFTESMLEYEKLNPEFTPADTASLATLDLILDYIFDQVFEGDLSGSTEHVVKIGNGVSKEVDNGIHRTYSA